MAQQTSLRANNRTLTILGSIFLGIGLLMLVIGGVLAWREHRFTAHAIGVQGEVVEVTEQMDNKQHQIMYGTRVAFRTSEGRTVTFTSHLRSSSPKFQQGESVPVQYDPSSPGDAQIDNAMEHWFGAIVLGGLGLVFGLVGALVLYFNYRASLRMRRLSQSGTRVQAKVVEVGLNPSIDVNGRHPWRIVCQWQDTRTGKVWLFNSSSIWFDPTPFIRNEQVDVLLDPANPRQYVVDTGFLPEAA